MSRKLKKALLTALKFAIAAALLGWVLGDVEWDEFFATLRRANFLLLVCALGGFVAALVVIGVRWWFLLRTQQIPIRLWEVIRLSFLGQFFNAVVPGTVGGDLVKAYYAAKHTPHKGAAMITVFVDRLMGLTELALLAAVMVAVLWAGGLATWEKIRTPAAAAAAALFAVAVMLVFLLSRRVRGLLHLQKIYRRLSIAHHIDSAGAAARRFRERLGDLIVAMAITLVAHGLWLASVALIGYSLGLQLPWYIYFVYIPLIYIIGAVPVTPGGVGLVENMYVLFFVSVAIGKAEIIALALVVRLFDILRGLPGAIVAVTGTKLPKAEAMEAELGVADTDEELTAAPAPDPAPDDRS